MMVSYHHDHHLQSRSSSRSRHGQITSKVAISLSLVPQVAACVFGDRFWLQFPHFTGTKITIKLNGPMKARA